MTMPVGVNPTGPHANSQGAAQNVPMAGAPLGGNGNVSASMMAAPGVHMPPNSANAVLPTAPTIPLSVAGGGARGGRGRRNGGNGYTASGVGQGSGALGGASPHVGMAGTPHGGMIAGAPGSGAQAMQAMPMEMMQCVLLSRVLWREHSYTPPECIQRTCPRTA
jgi:hypothetical protein